MTTRNKTMFALAVLFAINTMNFFDRQILGAVGETIKKEWELSDTALGTLGTAFTLLYAVIGVPLGRLTDRITRTWILAAGVTVWSLFTALSGIARNYAELFGARLGVGIGEASCAPAASSLIGDLFPATRRAKALSVFMMGLPIGIALSFAVSSWITEAHGWRPAFYIAGIPGLICAALALFLHEPQRGATEVHNISGLQREGRQNGAMYLLILWVIVGLFYYGYLRNKVIAPLLQLLYERPVNISKLDLYLGILWGVLLVVGILRKRAVGKSMQPFMLVLSIPTMWWLIASGALHNFNMYAIGSFLSPFLQRVHGQNPFRAGMVSMVAYGLSGIPGLLLGGMIGDAIMRRKANGRLIVGALSILISVPLVYSALGRAVGDILGFTVLMTLGMAAMYVYYSTVYSTIQDVIEPALRGSAMALYFFAMYVLGASLGPVGMGFLSDYFKERAARAAGVTEMTPEALGPYAGQGLHSALYIIPVLGLLLALVLFAGSRTVTKDMEKLQRWMRESAGKATTVESAEAATAD